MLLVRKALSSPSPCCLLIRTTVTTTTTPQPNFITQYLITSHGFSEARASASSKRILHISSPSQPDSVTHFLKHLAFTDSQIQTLIFRHPPILSADVASSLAPNLSALSSLGLSDPDVRRILLSNPAALLLPAAVPRLHFWLHFLDRDTKKLSLALTRNLGLVGYDIDRGVAPKIALLKSYGLTEADIGVLVVRGHGFFRRSLASMEALMKRVLAFGFPRGSPMLVQSLSSLSGVGSDTLGAKMEVYRSLGWSEEDFVSALKRQPFVVRLSEEGIRRKMEFLVGTAGCTPAYISLRPQLLTYSLERRLIPRFRVVRLLMSGDVVDRGRDFYKFMAVSEKEFLGSVVLKYKDRVPMLLETYAAGCAGKIQL